MLVEMTGSHDFWISESQRSGGVAGAIDLGMVHNPKHWHQI